MPGRAGRAILIVSLLSRSDSESSPAIFTPAGVTADGRRRTVFRVLVSSESDGAASAGPLTLTLAGETAVGLRTMVLRVCVLAPSPAGLPTIGIAGLIDGPAVCVAIGLSLTVRRVWVSSMTSRLPVSVSRPLSGSVSGAFGSGVRLIPAGVTDGRRRTVFRVLVSSLSSTGALS